MALATKFPPVIVGSGIAGLTLSIALSKHPQYKSRFGPRLPIILEKTPEFKPNAGAGLSLAPNSLPFLAQLGVYAPIAAHSQALDQVEVWSARSLNKIGSMRGEMYTGRWGYPLLTTERAALQHTLLDAATQLGVRVGFAKDVVAITENGESVVVECRDGEKIETTLVVAADGARSALRRLLYAEEGREAPPPTNTGISCLYGLSQKISEIPEGRTQWVMGDGEIWGSWALPNQHQFWFVNLCESERLAKNEEFTDTEVNETIDKFKDRWFPYVKNSKFGDVMDGSKRIIKVGLSGYAYDKVHGFGGKLLLIGDASHPMVPFAGQGANTGIEDVSTLVDILFSDKSSSEIGIEYQKLRVPRAKKIVNFANQTGTIMMSSGWTRTLRDLTFKVPESLLGMSMDWLYKVDSRSKSLN
ncbi:hypothetical protein HK096_001310 [Nowakowskiella sp. JEL0078]|nr:hypothetical protein HK096_001310 [Nowakowskiella sp. JEL0078]